MLTPTPTPTGNPQDDVNFLNLVIQFFVWVGAFLSGPALIALEKHNTRKKEKEAHDLASKKADDDAKTLERKTAQEVDAAQANTMKLTLEAANQAIVNYSIVLVRLQALDKQVAESMCEINILKTDKHRLEEENREYMSKVERLTLRVKILEDALVANKIPVPPIETKDI